ncbi:hypothetical protein RHMOL_Rhmol09G0157200 [Rhododendron molle]|uniref:Uncharacterized protein n=1 Tax=Rhododendron molle TaxID=49168 RepID=A0ACC0MED8_RHOML|nr:hypothetical protein RHMOL_Rhmol09G0157200 [Rhododendron molle]
MAKRKALELIRGDHRGQYVRLWAYCEMVRIQNPSSIVKIKVDTESFPEGGLVFERIFISYDGHLRGFLSGCRPIIRLDVYFLKDPFGGHLMHAVARDANNQMFPLAFTVVESETKASWTWFMGLLVNMIGDPEKRGWCFVSDKRKGLTQTFAELYPNVEHRYCIRHMYSNFSKVYKGKKWKDLMWKATSVYTVQEFEYHMNAIKKIDEGAYEYLISEDPKTWARCMYGLRSKCNRMDNNTSKAFNQAIKDARDEPILTMLESIRRKWDVCRIPCQHGMAAIITDKSNLEEFVDECFHISTFAKIYDFTIKPIPNQTIWVCKDLAPIEPPLFRVKSGRPKKNRRKGPDEPKNPTGGPSKGVKKYYTCLKCRICKQPGHNSRTCPQKPTSTTVEQKMAMAENLEMIMAEEMIIAEERELVPCTSSGREKDKNTGSGRGARGGKIAANGGRGKGTKGRGGRGKVGGGGTGRGGTMVVEGTGKGGNPTPNKGQVVVGGRGGGKGRGGSTPALPGVVIKERCEQHGGNNGKCKEPTIGKGKEPSYCKSQSTNSNVWRCRNYCPKGWATKHTAFIICVNEGWRRSTRLGNAVFWSRPSSSSGASCASGSATMPTIPIPRLDSQGATSTPKFDSEICHLNRF